jgi:hypothetical protein
MSVSETLSGHVLPGLPSMRALLLSPLPSHYLGNLVAQASLPNTVCSTQKPRWKISPGFLIAVSLLFFPLFTSSSTISGLVNVEVSPRLDAASHRFGFGRRRTPPDCRRKRSSLATTCLPTRRPRTRQRLPAPQFGGYSDPLTVGRLSASQSSLAFFGYHGGPPWLPPGFLGYQWETPLGMRLHFLGYPGHMARTPYALRAYH